MIAMSRFLAGVLSIIAVGIILIAYGLLSPQASAYNPSSAPNGPYAQNGLVTFAPSGAFAAPQGGYSVAQNPYAAGQPAYATYTPGQPSYAVAQPVYVSQVAAPVPVNMVRVAETTAAPQRVVTRTVVREPKRDWKKTAMVIGGSSAAGAGLGGIVGGKKGALIGAAIGGGASTLYESVKR